MIKNFTLSSLFLFFLNLVSAQLTVTEIMYNPPESGTDSLEYIEFTNTSSAAININGYSVTMAVEFTFPDMMLPAGSSVLVAESTGAMNNVFGVTSFQWNDPGALGNSGETIIVKDPNGNVIDEVAYNKIAPWPTDPDGQGSSLVLCDYNLDNSDGANWSAAINNTGITINGKIVKASPGADNQVSCVFVPDVLINATTSNAFSPKDVTINLNQTVQWKNVGGGNHNVNGSLATYPNNPEGFINGTPSTSNWEYHRTFTIPGVYQYQCDAHVGLGMKGTVTVVDNNTYPNLSIVEASAVNPTSGILSLLGQKASVTGIVYGVNIRPGGLQFVIIDGQNNGLAVFNASNTFGYTVTEGDEVTIKGTLEQFNGLAQIVVVEIQKNSSGNALVNPKVVTSLVEEDESSLIKINNLNYVDISQWLGDGSAFNVTLTDGTNEYQMRIDNDVELSTMPAPKAPFNVTSLLGQFDSSSPYLEGYQMLPRYAADIAEISAVVETIDDLNIFPNPVKDFLLFQTNETVKYAKVYSQEGKLMMSVKDPSGKIDMKQLPTASYYIRFESGNKISTKKVVKL